MVFRAYEVNACVPDLRNRPEGEVNGHRPSCESQNDGWYY